MTAISSATFSPQFPQEMGGLPPEVLRISTAFFLELQKRGHYAVWLGGCFDQTLVELAKSFFTFESQDREALYRTIWLKLFLPKLFKRGEDKPYEILTLLYKLVTAQSKTYPIAKTLFESLLEYIPTTSSHRELSTELVHTYYYWTQQWSEIIGAKDAVTTQLDREMRTIAEVEQAMSTGNTLIPKHLIFEALEPQIFSRLINGQLGGAGEITFQQKFPLLTAHFYLKANLYHNYSSIHFLGAWLERHKNSEWTNQLQVKLCQSGQDSKQALADQLSSQFHSNYIIQFQDRISSADLHRAFIQSISSHTCSKTKDHQNYFDLFQTFWFNVLNELKPDLVDSSQQFRNFSQRASYLIEQLFTKNNTYIVLAFLTALMRLEPSPLTPYFAASHIPQEIYLAFWRRDPQFEEMILKFPPRLDFLELLILIRFAKLSDPGPDLKDKGRTALPSKLPLEWQALMTEAEWSLFQEVLSKNYMTAEEAYDNWKKFPILTAYCALYRPKACHYQFQPILLREQLSIIKTRLAKVFTPFIDRFIAVTAAGRTLNATEATYHTANSPAATRTLRKDAFIDWVETEVIRDPESWKAQRLEAQRALIEERFKQEGGNGNGSILDEVLSFLAIPEHLGCYVSEEGLRALKRTMPSFFRRMELLQPGNLFLKKIS